MIPVRKLGGDEGRRPAWRIAEGYPHLLPPHSVDGYVNGQEHQQYGGIN